MENIPGYLNKYFVANSFILIYPMQAGTYSKEMDLTNPSIMEPLEKLDEIGKRLQLFSKENNKMFISL